MTEKEYARRRDAVRLADAVNKIEGAPISEYARLLSDKWARGEITGDEMIEALVAKHKRRLSEVKNNVPKTPEA